LENHTKIADKAALFKSTVAIARGQREAQPLAQARRDEPLTASIAQQRIWFLERLRPDTAAHNLTVKHLIKGALSVNSLELSLAALVRRHEVLRTSFRYAGEQLTVSIQPFGGFTLPRIDLSDYVDPLTSANNRVLLEASEPISLSGSSLIRARLYCLGKEEFLFTITVHHIAFDGWSYQVFMNELCTLYSSYFRGEPPHLPELNFQYVDFSGWQNARFAGGVIAPLRKYWLQQMEGAPPVLALPADRERGFLRGSAGNSCTGLLSRELVDEVEQVAKREGVTTYTVLLAAFKLLLSRYSGENDIVVGTASANRSRLELTDMVGLFVNTLALRTRLSDDLTFSELLTRVSAVVLGAHEHQEMPFETLVGMLNPPRDKDGLPVIQVVFNYLRFPKADWAFPGLTVEATNVANGTARFDLTMTVGEADEGLYVLLEYDASLFEETTIARMLDHYRCLLSRLLTHTGPVFNVSLLSEAEEHQILVEWNNTTRDFPQPECIHQLFERQVDITPEKPALIFNDQQLSYRELNQQANQFARYLIEQEIVPGTVVAVFVERSLYTTALLLGILKAGGSYLPLDTSYPAARLGYMLEDSKAGLLITQPELKDSLPKYDGRCVLIDNLPGELSNYCSDNLDISIPARAVAYVIYTSGSSGKPKGVMGTHQAFVNFVYAIQNQIPLSAQDRFLAATSLSFDPHMVELYLPFALGATAILVETSTLADTQTLQKILVDQAITLAQATPTIWSLLATNNFKPLRPLKILSGGEPISDALHQYFTNCQEVTAWNVYGPSEATGWSLIQKLEKGGISNRFGKSIDNVRSYVVNKRLQLQPPGVPGELCLAGVNLVQGYVNNKSLSREKFIGNPFSELPNDRLYLTGDLARRLPDGSLELMGRSDNQVKIRGIRIELGEIEAALQAHAWVEHAVLIAQDIGGSRRLLAYMTLADGEQIRQLEKGDLFDQLRAHLQQRLPNYMVPHTFAILDAFPLTPSGKVDRKNLPDCNSDPVAAYAGPSTDVEKLICDIWTNVLKLERIGIADNFFELGGDSLSALQMVLDIEEKFATNFPLSMIFEYPTIQQLSVYLTDKENPLFTGDGLDRQGEALVVIRKGQSSMPLFLVPGGRGGKLEMTLYARAMSQIRGDCPVYGLMAKGVEGGETSHVSVEEMATAYIAEIRTVQPSGPYALAGECVGGVIAYEMAQQLREDHQAVALLLLMDSWCPSTVGTFYYTRVQRPLVLWRERFVTLWEGLKVFRRACIVHIGARPRTVKPIGAWLRFAVSLSRALASSLLDVIRSVANVGRPQKGAEAGFQAETKYIESALHYRPKNYHGDIRLLVSEESMKEGICTDWSEMVQGSSRVDVVPGDHETYFACSSKQIADHIGNCMSEAAGSTGPVQ
jgi:amino acid adenylation domain-containing protein